MADAKEEWVISGFAKGTGGTAATVPSLWNFYDTREQAEAALVGERAAAIAAHYAEGTTRVMTYDEFKAVEKKAMITDEITEISEKDYRYALEVLPPMGWKRDGGIERFFMSERVSGSYTHMYAATGDRYFSKLVDLSDKATWITADAIREQFPEGPRP